MVLVAVLDTNILISALVFHGYDYDLLRAAKAGIFKATISAEILREFIDVSGRAKFGLKKEEAELAVTELLDTVEIVASLSKVDIVKKDPDDNIIIAAALDSGADYIVSNDRHVLAVESYKNIKIVDAKSFRQILGI